MSTESMSGGDRPDDSAPTSDGADESDVLRKLEKALEESLAEIELASAEATPYGAPDGVEEDAMQYEPEPQAVAPMEELGLRGNHANVATGLAMTPPWLRKSPSFVPGGRNGWPDLARQPGAAVVGLDEEPLRQIHAERIVAQRMTPSFLRHPRPRRPVNDIQAGRMPPDNARHRVPSDPRGASDDEAFQEDPLRRLIQQPHAEAYDVLNRSHPPRRLLNRVGQTAAVVFLSAGVAFGLMYILNVRPTSTGGQQKSAVASFAPSAIGTPITAAPTPQSSPRLVTGTLSGATNRVVALGVNLNGAAPGASVLVRGLPPGSHVTVGQAEENGAWRVPVRELTRAAVMPPSDFVGTMNLSVDLRLADGRVVDSDIQQLNWTPGIPESVVPKPVTTTVVRPRFVPAPAPRETSNVSRAGSGEAKTAERSTRQASAPAPALRRLEQDEIANLLRRGLAALRNDDISAARLLLRRAAEAGNAQAALALAATYDPMTLKEFGELGAKADVAQARHWYRKAADAGSTEARQRLQLIAQQSP